MEEQRERLQLQTTKLYDAALVGDVPFMLNLLREDPLILHRCSIEKTGHFTQSPLHVAANLGHLEFVTEILRREPDLAEELDHSQRSSPLHVSSAKGHLEIVKALLAVNPDMCLVRDQQGRNPLHIAAIRGHIHVLDELVRNKPQAARERTSFGDTVLHLCVKHIQPKALKFLINAIHDSELLNFKDNGGNTALHLAVAAREPEMVNVLLKDKGIEKNAINANSLTAMDICIRSWKDISNGWIWRSLRRAKALEAKEVLKPHTNHRNWLENQRNALMIVASLIATMAFQVGVNPPGGVWQQDDNVHKVGTSVMAGVKIGQHDIQYDVFLVSNTVGLVSSLSVILLLISGLPCKRLFVGILMATLWIAVTATTVTYLVSVNFLVSTKQDQTSLISYKGRNILISSKENHPVQLAIVISSFSWLVLMILLLIGHAIRLITKMIKQLGRFVITVFGTRATIHPPI